MRHNFAYIFLLISLFFSCADETKIKEGIRVATFEIEGMVCEMGCGASLRKGLYATNAVDAVDVEYEEERNENLIHVHYQSGKIDPEKMQEIIEKLNDNQFNCTLKTDRAEEEDFSKTKESEGASSKNTGVDGIEASTESFNLPNLTELLNSLIY